MTILHLICKQKSQLNWRSLGGGAFKTGAWVVSDEVANRLLDGGRIYLHDHQDGSAWHGGVIESWESDPGDQRRKWFTYRVDGDFRIRRRGGWGQEKCIVEQAVS